MNYVESVTKNKIAINDGEHEKHVYEKDLDNWLSQGWILGGRKRIRKYPPWNKGLTKETDSSGALKRISEATKIQNSHRDPNINTKISENLKSYYKNLSEDDKIKLKKQRKEAANRNKRHWYNNGITRLFIAEGDPIPEGFIKGNFPRSEESKRKSENTKRKNKSFNTSIEEKEYLKYLQKLYDVTDILTDYKSEVYPYRCDFYIKSLDLYIELNLHWTHGKHPFDKNNLEDQKILNEWREKAETSQFYKNAIEIWTKRDVQKRNVASLNKLNYHRIYNDEWKEILCQIKKN